MTGPETQGAGAEGPGDAGPDVGVVVPAAGSGRRMGGRRKQYLELDGQPVLLRAIRPFLRRRDVVEVVVALPPDDVEAPPGWLVDADPRVRLVPGGETRGASVRAGVEALSPEARIVAIHDGARPLLDADTVERCLEEARGGRGAVAGWPAVDTMKQVDDSGRILRTPERSSLWHAQTPQVFPRDVIAEAYRSASEGELSATDDSALVERRGGSVHMVRGSSRNIKVTRSDDMAVAETLLRLDRP